MNHVIEHLREMLRPNVAWWAFFAALALALIGISAIAGSSQPAHAFVQLRWLCISLVVMLVVMIPNPRLVQLITTPLVVVVIGLLLLLILPGVPSWLVHTRNGARCWINLGFMNLQPSELAKILFVLVLARYMRFRENYRALRGLAAPFVITLVPFVLIFIQPDLGTAILFIPALFVMLLAAGAKLRHMMAMVGLGLTFVAISVLMIYVFPDDLQLLKHHQRTRIRDAINLAFDQSKADTQNSAFQQNTAMNLLGAGGLTGYGKQGSQVLVRYNQLPEDHNDMIFALVVNRWGFFGGLVVLALYLVFAISLLSAATRSRDPFARLAIVGFAGLVFTQAVINIGMTVNLLPIIGITLPFVSYGGSSLMASFMMVGLVMNFASRRPVILARPSFEFDNADAIFQ